jgi:hypothetical protein
VLSKKNSFFAKNQLIIDSFREIYTYITSLLIEIALDGNDREQKPVCSYLGVVK